LEVPLLTNLADLSDLVQETTVGDEEMQPLVAVIQQTIADMPRIPAMVALTYVLLLLQNPTLTPEQLAAGVEDVSRFVCLWLSAADDEALITRGEELPPSKVN
jgi:hypothetical protein